MSLSLDGRRFACVDGNPTSEENAVLAAVLASVSDDEGAENRSAGEDGRSASTDHGAESDAEREREAAPVRELEDHRRCPICDRRFDSQYVLTEQRRITTSKDSTLCLDTEYDKIYLHSAE